MLFSRRIPADWREKLRISLWPRRSWARSAKYFLKRILRLTGSPHAISAGVAAGVFASFTPFMGFHFVTAFVVAYLIAGNLIAAAMGTFFGNPISFPFIWAATYSTGNFILNRTSDQNQNSPQDAFSSMEPGGLWEHGFTTLFDQLANVWNPIIKPMLIGAIPVGVSISIVAYIITRWLAVKFRDARQKRLAKKAAEIRALKNNMLDAAIMQNEKPGLS